MCVCSGRCVSVAADVRGFPFFLPLFPLVFHHTHAPTHYASCLPSHPPLFSCTCKQAMRASLAHVAGDVRVAPPPPPPSPSHTHAHRHYISLVQVAADMRISLLFFLYPLTRTNTRYTTLAQVAGDMRVVFTYSPFPLTRTKTQALCITGAGGRRRARFPHFFPFSLPFPLFPPFFFSPTRTHTAITHHCAAGRTRAHFSSLYPPFPSLFFLFPLTRANTGTTRRWRRWRETCASFSMI